MSGLAMVKCRRLAAFNVTFRLRLFFPQKQRGGTSLIGLGCDDCGGPSLFLVFNFNFTPSISLLFDHRYNVYHPADAPESVPDRNQGMDPSPPAGR